MKKIDLNSKILGFDGKPIRDSDKKRDMVLKDLLLNYVGYFQSQDGAELIAASVLAHKIYKAVGIIELNEDETKTLKKAVETPRHVAVVYAAMMERLNNEL